jgi:hypothetical protein
MSSISTTVLLMLVFSILSPLQSFNWKTTKQSSLILPLDPNPKVNPSPNPNPNPKSITNPNPNPNPKVNPNPNSNPNPKQSFRQSSSCAAQRRERERQPVVDFTSEYLIDGQAISDGSLVEYINAKGSKRLAIVSKKVGAHLEVRNDAKKSFSVPISRITYHINGSFAFGDLLRLNEILGELKPIQVERLWESTTGQTNPNVCNLMYISKQMFGSTDAVRRFASMKLMTSFGSVFFEKDPNVVAIGDEPPEVIFLPLQPNVVQLNLRNRAALKEFKQRFLKVMTSQTGKYIIY